MAAPRPALVPAWVHDMDELILRLDAEMTQVLSGGASVAEPLARVRQLLQLLWPNVEAMAGACGNGDERWRSVADMGYEASPTWASFSKSSECD